MRQSRDEKRKSIEGGLQKPSLASKKRRLGGTGAVWRRPRRGELAERISGLVAIVSAQRWMELMFAVHALLLGLPV